MPQTNAPKIGSSETAEQAQMMRDLCDLAQTLTDARALTFVLLSPDMEPVRSVLMAHDMQCRIAANPLPAFAPGSGPYRLADQGAHASDSLSFGLPLSSGDMVLGQLEFDAARPDVLAQRFAGTLVFLASQITRRLLDLKRGGAGLPQRMLALVESVTDHDDAAGSRVLTGLLRLASGGVPSMVEVTALRIAGLAELIGTRVSLTEEGRQTLMRGGVEPRLNATLSVSMPPVEVVRRQAPPLRPRPEWKPFARLSISTNSFLIGEAGEYDPLAYKVEGSDADWLELRNALEDGWAEIAAEIIGSTHDVLNEYAAMHMIRRRDLPVEELTEIYDLHGLSWMVRPTDNGHETCVVGKGWQPLTLHLEHSASIRPLGRNIAISALLQHWPDLGERIGHDLRSWSRRMAAGAKVTPILSPVAA